MHEETDYAGTTKLFLLIFSIFFPNVNRITIRARYHVSITFMDQSCINKLCLLVRQ
jgi:hypothetical protein